MVTTYFEPGLVEADLTHDLGEWPIVWAEAAISPPGALYPRLSWGPGHSNGADCGAIKTIQDGFVTSSGPPQDGYAEPAVIISKLR